MPSDPGLVSTRQVSRNLSINLRRYQMKMTMDDANNIVDTLSDEDKTLTIDQQVDGSVVIDMGKFLVAYANATCAYVATKKTEFQIMKGEAQ
jgi:hypothetical protein